MSTVDLFAKESSTEQTKGPITDAVSFIICAMLFAFVRSFIENILGIAA